MKLAMVVLGVLAASGWLASAQVANEGLANAIIAARRQNTALMQQYSWNCRTELEENSRITVAGKNLTFLEQNYDCLNQNQ